MRWTSWAPVPNKRTVSVDVKRLFNINRRAGGTVDGQTDVGVAEFTTASRCELQDQRERLPYTTDMKDRSTNTHAQPSMHCEI